MSNVALKLRRALCFQAGGKEQGFILLPVKGTTFRARLEATTNEKL
jgi:hypothetical protein